MPVDFEVPERIHRYRFSCEDRSLVQAPFDRLINRPLLSRTPRELNPNVLTFTGHAAAVFVFLLLAAITNAAISDVTLRLVALCSALLLFLYCITDSMDGLQARRIGVSNPLGDFYDHGLDAFAGFSIPLGGFAAYGATANECMVLAVAFSLGWWSNNLDRRRTNSLVLPPFGAMEGNFLAIVVHLATVVAGGALWRARVGSVGAADVLTVVAALGYAAVGVEALVKVGRERRNVLGIGVNVALVCAWHLQAQSMGGVPGAPLLGPVVLCLVAVKHNWDILRNILFGTRYRGWDLQLTALLVGWNVTLHLPGGYEVQTTVAAGVLVMVALKLGWQLMHSTRFAVGTLGLGLLVLTPEQRRRDPAAVANIPVAPERAAKARTPVDHLE
ncbi:MAG: CDP-alcohol phosphatidyltransferase family protein [Myxococcota bacterium]